jgi:hypothetical protein
MRLPIVDRNKWITRLPTWGERVFGYYASYRVGTRDPRVLLELDGKGALFLGGDDAFQFLCNINALLWEELVVNTHWKDWQMSLDTLIMEYFPEEVING